MQRSIKFSKFRNIGLEKDEYLILNSDFQKGKMGNLIILIGPNNSGKSNVLDGIVKVCTGSNLEERDITDLYYEDQYRHPSLSLVYRDDRYTFELKREYEKTFEWKIVSGELDYEKPTKETIIKEIGELNSIFVNTFGIRLNRLSNLVAKAPTLKSNELYDEAINSIREFYDNYRGRTINSGYRYQTYWDILKGRGFKLIAHFEEIAGSVAPFIQKYLSKTGVKNATPKCISYVENQIKNSDLIVSNVSDVGNRKFFKSLLKAMKMEAQTILNAYSQFGKNGNVQVLRKLEKDLQKKLDRINSRFNELYFASNDQYKFTIACESEKIMFGMARGKDDEAINLEYQSTGFRWFFNLFFNFLSSNELEPGDIVIMDEPATNLHVKGQNELRSFIKQFAIENDILFVLATHSPFLLDVDHYDELRVVSMENNRSKIQNRFSAIDLDDPDSLLPIKDSLTIKQNVLYDLDTEVYFVEGITDYNYLTMFKKLLGIEHIAFLPFNGVGNNTAQTKKILAELIKVRFHKRSLLVDADKAGQDMFKQAQSADFNSIHSMSEVKLTDVKNAMMVEDLFSAEDKKKFHAIGNKNSDGTSVMKDHCKLSDFSKSTIENFKELFKILQD